VGWAQALNRAAVEFAAVPATLILSALARRIGLDE